MSSFIIGLERDLADAAEASGALHTTLENEIRDHEELQRVVQSLCGAFEARGGLSGSSLRSRAAALGGHIHSQLRDLFRTGVKRALAVVSSHYALNLEAVSEGYVLPDEVDDDQAEEEVQKLLAAVEGPGTALAQLLEDDVLLVPPPNEEVASPEDARALRDAPSSDDARDL